MADPPGLEPGTTGLACAELYPLSYGSVGRFRGMLAKTSPLGPPYSFTLVYLPFAQK